MKIIGKTDEGYIVEIHRYEMQRLSGVAETSPRDRPWALKVGSTVDIKSTVDQAQKIRESEAERKRIAEQLRAAASVIEQTKIIVSTPNEEEK